MENAKQNASYQAVSDQISDSSVIGIGSGSTVVYAVEKLGLLHRQGINIKACIPSSFQAQQLILDNGLPLASLNEYPEIDVAFDGADEVDPNLNCIKGGGGCHLQEKLVISNAKKWFIVADQGKKSQKLGSIWKKGIPLEVVPMAYRSILIKLSKMNSKPVLRLAKSKAGPVVTDSGNFIIDADFGPISNPQKLDEDLHRIPGIIETGLFVGMANGVYYGMADGTVTSCPKLN